MISLDFALFAILPYVAAALAVVGTVERYRRHPFSCTSGSSQFLENRRHFWAMVPFHAGILVVLAAHVVGLLMPGRLAELGASPRVLLAVEALGLTFGVLAVAGFALVLIRRASDARLRLATGPLDVVVYLLLFVQLAGGVAVALVHTWGVVWYGGVAAPYFASLLRLSPDVDVIAAMPPLVKIHIACAWLLVALFPFSRLVHIVAVPNPYLWRRPQVVRWLQTGRTP
jgi:nitrate reductase gamma subunit